MYTEYHVVLTIVRKEKKTWLLGEFEGRWSTRRQGGEWGTDARDVARTGVSERLPSKEGFVIMLRKPICCNVYVDGSHAQP